MIIQEDLYGNWEYNYSIMQKLIQIHKQDSEITIEKECT